MVHVFFNFCLISSLHASPDQYLFLCTNCDCLDYADSDQILFLGCLDWPVSFSIVILLTTLQHPLRVCRGTNRWLASREATKMRTHGSYLAGGFIVATTLWLITDQGFRCMKLVAVTLWCQLRHVFTPLHQFLNSRTVRLVPTRYSCRSHWSPSNLWDSEISERVRWWFSSARGVCIFGLFWTFPSLLPHPRDLCTCVISGGNWSEEDGSMYSAPGFVTCTVMEWEAYSNTLAF